MKRALTLTDDERKRAARVGELSARSAVGELLRELDDPSWSVRRTVVAALAAMGELAGAPLCALLRDGRDNEARIAAAVDALVACRGDVDGPVLALLESKDPAVVCDGLQILGRRRTAVAVARIAVFIDGEDDNVALAAIEALGRIGEEEALLPLIAAVEQRNFFRAFPAIDVLGRSGSLRAVKPLLSMLDEPHYAIDAARALGRIGDPAAVLPLIALLAKPNDALVRAAATALGEIHDRQAERLGNTGVVTSAFARAGMAAATRRLVQCLDHADSAEQTALVRVLSWVGGDSAVVALVDLLTADHAAAASSVAALARLGTAAEPHLLAALRVADSDRRLLILPLLSHKSTVVEPVADCLTDPSPTVRALACDALARIGETAVAPRLFELLSDRDARASQSAIAAIQSLAAPETERLALLAAQSADTRVRRAGLRIVAYFGYPSAVGVLVAAMTDADERIRDAAIFGLPFVDDARAIDALLAAAAHPSARTRAAAVRAIGQAPRQPRATSALRAGLHDPDAWVRYFACQALSRIKDVDSADMIAALVGDPAGQVRVAVIEALAHLKGARALDALHRAATGGDADVQRAALLGLGYVKDPTSLGLLREAMKGPDAATRLVAVSALAEYDLPEIADDLGAALGDADDSVRNAAIALLAPRPGPSATRALVAQLRSPGVQSRAVAALAQPVEGRVEGLAEALKSATAVTAPLIVAALARMHRGDAALALEDGFATQGAAVRRAIAKALAVLETGSSRALLVHAAAQDPDEEVRAISTAATSAVR